MKFNKLILCSLILCAITTSCVINTRIASDYKKNVEFSKYSTYELLKNKEDFSYGLNSINQQRIEQAIQREMMTQGYKISSSNPDLIVACFVKEKLVQQKDYSYRGYYLSWGFPIWADVNHYKEGTLIIDLIDSKSKEVVWHGASTATMSDDMHNVEEKINKKVQAILEQFYEDSHQSNGNSSSTK